MSVRAARPIQPGSGTIAFVTQTFPPVTTAVGQLFEDVATEFAERGYHVVVYTATAGYEDSTHRYASREVTSAGVEIRRLPFSSFGKRVMALRIVGAASFLLQCVAASLCLPNLRAMVVSTSPPFAGIAGGILDMLRRVPFAYWAMDLNPDQLLAVGKLHPQSVAADVLEAMNRFVLRRARIVVALDCFMAQRITVRRAHPRAIAVLPPWSPIPVSAPRSRELNSFRTEQAIGREIVIMYSGNHTPVNPLTTLLDAAVELRNESNIRFLFVGGGLSMAEVRDYIRSRSLSNVTVLPYQPRSRLAESLAAADVHVVTLGDALAGIVHPSKVYGAMAVGRPLLYFGPVPSHVSAIIDRYNIGWQVRHGDVAGAVKAIRAIVAAGPEQLEIIGARARAAVDRDYQPRRLRRRFCNLVEDELRLARDVTQRPPSADGQHRWQ